MKILRVCVVALMCVLSIVRGQVATSSESSDDLGHPCDFPRSDRCDLFLTNVLMRPELNLTDDQRAIAKENAIISLESKLKAKADEED